MNDNWIAVINCLRNFEVLRQAGASGQIWPKFSIGHSCFNSYYQRRMELSRWTLFTPEYPEIPWSPWSSFWSSCSSWWMFLCWWSR